MVIPAGYYGARVMPAVFPSALHNRKERYRDSTLLELCHTKYFHSS
jgi:hypothetical protein